jgi:hypothetical protein
MVAEKFFVYCYNFYPIMVRHASVHIKRTSFFMLACLVVLFHCLLHCCLVIFYSFTVVLFLLCPMANNNYHYILTSFFAIYVLIFSFEVLVHDCRFIVIFTIYLWFFSSFYGFFVLLNRLVILASEPFL